MRILYTALKSRILTVLAIGGLLPLLFFQASTRKATFWLFLAAGLPLVLNLICCLIDHWRRRGLASARNWSFWLFHFAFLVIIIGGLASSLTRTSDYVTMLENGEPFDLTRLAGRSTFAWPAPGVRLGMKDIVIDLWPDRKLRDIVDSLELVDRDGSVVTEEIAVNSPLSFRGLIISMTRDYGLAPHFTLINPGGITTGHVTIPHREGKSFFRIPGNRFRGAVIEKDYQRQLFEVRFELDGRTIITRDMRPGQTIAFGANFFRIDKVVEWSELNIVHDPLRYVIYAGFVLFLVMVLIYFGLQLQRK